MVDKKRSVIWTIIIILSILLSGCMRRSYVNWEYFKIDESKNKLAVIIKNGGIYDTPEITSRLEDFLESVKNDLGVENIGICYTNASSLDELDQFIEKLYHEKDMGYAILIGRDLPITESSLLDELPYIEEKEPSSLPFPHPRYYYDIAISWLIAPASYSDEEKISFMSKVISAYIYYHNNAKEVLEQFNDSCLYISYYSSFLDLHYDLEMIKLRYNEGFKIEKELKRKHKALFISTHGIDNLIEMSVANYSGDNFFSAEEYVKFVEENGLPALFVEEYHCGNRWVTQHIGCGVWALFSTDWGIIEERGDFPPCGGGLLRRGLTEEPFLGYIIRHHVMGVLVYGDITAHMI